MADVSVLKDKIQKWAEAVNERAVNGMLDEDRQRVPRSAQSPNPGPSNNEPTLAASRIENVNGLHATVEYPTDNANYQEFGTGPHRIPARGKALAFYWPSGPIEVKSKNGIVFRAWVDHLGSHKNDGWFSKTWNEQRYQDGLKAAADQIGLQG